MLDNLNLEIKKTLEKRKYLLKKQIIDAITANDDNLHSLLKSQWAHRFGVESLEELEDLDLKQFNQNTDNSDDQKIDKSQDNFLEGEKAIEVKNKNQKYEIKTKVYGSSKDVNKETMKSNSYKSPGGKHNQNEANNQFEDKINKSEIKVLIPLPPKPRYGFLNKWLLRN